MCPIISTAEGPAMPGSASDDDAGRGALALAERQLRRMWGMNALYHRAASTAASARSC